MYYQCMRGPPLTLLYLYNSLSNDNDLFLSWFSCCYLNPHYEDVFCMKRHFWKWQTQ